MSRKELDLITHTYDHEHKCGMCGFRYTTLWTVGEEESEDLAMCGSCTVSWLSDSDDHTIVVER